MACRLAPIPWWPQFLQSGGQQHDEFKAPRRVSDCGGSGVSVDLSRIATSQPVNKTAARVMGGGVHFDDGRKIVDTLRHFDAPPKCIDPENYPNDPSFQDMRGVRVGQVVVIGFLGRLGRTRNAKPQWLVRCDCGQFETRSAKFLRAGSEDYHACARCSYNYALKHGLRADWGIQA